MSDSTDVDEGCISGMHRPDPSQDQDQGDETQASTCGQDQVQTGWFNNLAHQHQNVYVNKNINFMPLMNVCV